MLLYKPIMDVVTQIFTPVESLASMKWARRNENNQEQRTRAAKTNNLCEAHGGKILSSTFMNDAAKLWNIAPESIKNCVTVSSVKKQIKLFTATLPI